jgi:transcriptional regulator with XRE-family HTH domain
VKQQSIDIVYKELGKRIVVARQKKGLSQEQLANACDIDRSHIGFIEQSRRRPTVSTLVKITNALDTTLEQLFKGL